jgi:hypothetical protein
MIILNSSLQLVQIRRLVMMLLNWIEQVAGFSCIYISFLYSAYVFLVYRSMIACIFVVIEIC